MGRNNNPQTKLRATLRIKTRVHPREEEEEEEDEKKKPRKQAKGDAVEAMEVMEMVVRSRSGP